MQLSALGIFETIFPRSEPRYYACEEVFRYTAVLVQGLCKVKIYCKVGLIILH